MDSDQRQTGAKWPNVNAAVWRRARKCDNSSGNCVEVAEVGNATAVRDSKNPNGPVLVYTRNEWTAFLNGVKDGDFDQSRDLNSNPLG
jgi:hypothetical protein